MKNLWTLLIPALLVSATLSAQTRHSHKHNRRSKQAQYGIASFYANKFQGRAMASGKPYDKNKMTCAHNSLPMGTWVKVTNLRNRKWVIVQVTDRLHHKNKRLVDLSRAAAAKLGYVKRGLTRVKLEVVGKNRMLAQE